MLPLTPDLPGCAAILDSEPTHRVTERQPRILGFLWSKFSVACQQHGFVGVWRRLLVVGRRQVKDFSFIFR